MIEVRNFKKRKIRAFTKGEDLRKLLFILCIMLIVSGCGGLNYSQTFQQGYKAKTIAVFPVESGIYKESDGVADKAIAEVLADKGRFEKIVTAQEFKSRLGSQPEFKKVYDEYISKLKLLNYSDPALSSRIGRMCGAECFLLPTVEQWNYFVENDKKLARVGLSFRLIDAGTGKDVWKSAHTDTDSYMLLKPELSGVSRKLAARMLAEMPR